MQGQLWPRIRQITNSWKTRVQAQSLLDSDESAWCTEGQHARNLPRSPRHGGDANSDAGKVDGLANFEVLDPQVHQRDGKAVISATGLEAGFGQVNFAQEVGKLNTRQAELEGLL